MKYFIINNDNTSIDHPLFHKAWIEDGYAYTSGNDKYGMALKRLEKEDFFFVMLEVWVLLPVAKL
jgi:hypothetical protein